MQLSDYFFVSVRGARMKLANDIGAHASDVSDWSSGARPVPVHYCLAIERATHGAVTRRDLRPDDAHLIWPDLSDQAQPTTVEVAHD